MACSCKQRRPVLSGLILTIGFWANANDAPASGVLAVVVHRSSSVDNLSTSALRKMLQGDLLTWPDSTRVVVIEQPETSATQQKALLVLFKTTPAVYTRQLLKTQFQGKELPIIRILNSDLTAIKFVWNVPGTIAIVDESAAMRGASLIKVLRIDGKLPAEAGYSLK
jgi:hypothetical protein